LIKYKVAIIIEVIHCNGFNILTSAAVILCGDKIGVLF